jgi:sigma-B regulation protein RsbU (phosphoserine phosphatase)
MTRAAPDWLLELRNARGAGTDAIALFRGVEPSVIVEAIKDCEIRVLPVGETLLQPGQSNDTIYVLLSGELSAYLDGAQRPETGIPIQPGESVGEMSAIDGKPASAFVVAVTESRLLVLPGKLFWSGLANVLGVTRNLLTSLSERMRRGNDAMLEAQRKQLAVEQVRRELQIARQLQTSMIPSRGRLFPERADIEIAGTMDPASDVGGDFFDAFFADERHLFFCVGDVSGHGIPAALFMARAIGLIRIAAMGTRHPEQLLERLNEQLCTRNTSSIFVTLFCAFLNVVSGRLVYANGGHCPAFLAHEGRASTLPMPKGTLVGVRPGLRYAANEVGLERGATLVCYTDGVTEAESAVGQAFSEDRLLRAGAANCGQSVEDLLGSVQQELTTFLGGVPLADDCTLVAVRRPLRSELR